MTLRIAARLDIKAPNLVKGIHLEGLRVVGDPAEAARRYHHEGIDELFYQDIVASLYARSTIIDLIRSTASEVFVPLTVGGGLRSLEDIQSVLRAGADKVSLNTAAVARPELISEAAARFGSQCLVVAIEAIRGPSGEWFAFTDNGRTPTGLEAVEWAARAVELGAGELLLTSVDRDGTRRGTETELVSRVAAEVRVPVIAHGGVGTPDHVVDAARAGASCVAIASALHFRDLSVADVKATACAAGFMVRT